MGKLINYLLFLTTLAILIGLGTRFIYQSKASGLNLNLKLKLQGTYKSESKITLRIDLYQGNLKVATFNNVQLKYNPQKQFEGLVMLTENLDLSKPYAMFIKPEKHIGQLFCSVSSVGTACTTPAFQFATGLNQVDLTNYLFYAGDLPPQDGKVDSADISKILAKIGKNDAATDINLDQFVNGVDFTLAQKTLSLSKVDDPTSQLIAVTPTSTPAPSPTATITPTPIQSQPTATLIPTRIPTPRPATPTPTRTPTPTTPPQSSRGKCNATLTGQVKISYLGNNECRVLNESTHFCVNNQSECTNTACVTRVKSEIAEGVRQCGYGMATFDQSSPINCTVSFVADNACSNPPADTSCDDDSPLCQ